MSSPGDRYKAIVHLEWGCVRQAARRCGVPEPTRDDIAIEVFLRLQKHLPLLGSRAAIRAWLRKATRLVAHEHFEATASLLETPTPSELLAAVELVPDLEEGYLQKERFQALLARVEELPPEMRKMFHAHTIDGLSIAQIGALCHLPPTTVFYRLRDLQDELQEALRGGDGAPPLSALRRRASSGTGPQTTRWPP